MVLYHVTTPTSVTSRYYASLNHNIPLSTEQPLLWLIHFDFIGGNSKRANCFMQIQFGYGGLRHTHIANST
jgi:hypothetical protein